MKSKNILEALDAVDEELIIKSEPGKRKKKAKTIRCIALIAAAVMLCTAIPVGVALDSKRTDTPFETSPATEPGSTPDQTTEPSTTEPTPTEPTPTETETTPTDDPTSPINISDAEKHQGLYFAIMPEEDCYTLVAVEDTLSCVEIPSTYNDKLVTSIEKSVIESDAIEELYIPSTVDRISISTVGKIGRNLRKIVVDEDNPNYYSRNNCVINNENKIVLGCNASVIPDDGTITAIGVNAFIGCEKFTKLVLPDSVKTIGRGAFRRCTSLKSVSLANAVVNGYAFAECTSLTEITLPCQANDGVFMGCTSLARVTVEKGTTVGAGAFEGCTSLVEVVLPDTVLAVNKNAFSGCTSLALLDLPANITELQEKTFYGCSSLVSITLPERLETVGDSAFEGCTALTDLSITSRSLRQLGARAFYGVNVTGEVHLPVVTHISKSCFENCTQITTISVGEESRTDCDYIADCAFRGCTALKTAFLRLKNGVGKACFENCTALEEVTLDGVGVLYGRAFADCSALKKLILPESLYSMNDDALTGSGIEELYIPARLAERTDWDNQGKTVVVKAEKLKKLVFSDGIKNLNYHFNVTACKELTEIILPSNLEQINLTILNNLPSLQPVYLPAGVNFCSGSCQAKLLAVDEGNEKYACAGNCFINKQTKALLFGDLDAVIPTDGSVESISGGAFTGSAITSVIIPEGVRAIGESAFGYCRSLVEVTLPESIETIGENAFFYCTSLRQINLPGSLKTLGSGAFKNCEELRSPVIPSSLEVIPDAAFAYCTSIETLTIPEGVKEIRADAFHGCSGIRTIQLPASLTSIYHENQHGDYTQVVCASFGYCTPKTITVAAGSSTYKVENNALIEFSTRTLILASENATIPEGIKWIAGLAFYGQSNETLVVPEGVLDLGAYAFCCMRELKTVVLPDSLKTISSFCFAGDTKLTDVTVGTGLTKTGYAAFLDCPVARIDARGESESCKTVGKCLIVNGVLVLAEKDCAAIPEDAGITKIAEYAFDRCLDMIDLMIPECVTEVCSYAFNNCRNIRRVMFPSTLGVTDLPYGQRLGLMENAFFFDPSQGRSKIEIVFVKNSETPLSMLIHSGVFSSKNLSDVFFAGTSTIWQEVIDYVQTLEIDENGREEYPPLRDAVIHYGCTFDGQEKNYDRFDQSDW